MDDSKKVDHCVEVNEMVRYLRREFKYLQEAKEFYEDQVNYKAADLLARTEAKRVEAVEALADALPYVQFVTDKLEQAALDAREGGE